MILLDTNVVSELMRAAPDQKVLAWFDAHENIPLYLCTVSEAELWAGFHHLPDGQRRSAIGAAITAMLAEDFAGRILPFDSAAAFAFGKISGQRKSLGRPISTADAQIAAIAQVHGFRLVTRNTADFEGCGVDVVNPWVK